MTAYEQCVRIRHTLLTRMSEVLAYSWDQAFARDYVLSTISVIKNSKWYAPVDVNDLTSDECDALMFSKSSYKGNPVKLRLLPLWLLPFLADELEAYSITGEKVTQRYQIDNDNRAGYLAFGILPKTADAAKTT